MVSKRPVRIVCGLVLALAVQAGETVSVAWQRVLELPVPECAACSVKETPQGELLVAVSGDGFEQRMYVAKLDRQGHPAWCTALPGRSFSWGSLLQCTGAGESVLAGRDETSGSFCLVKVGLDGKELWSRVFSPYHITFSSTLLRTREGGFAIGGTTLVDRFRRLVLIKTDANGVQEWVRTYYKTGGTLNGVFMSLTCGGFILTANDRPSAGYGGTDARSSPKSSADVPSGVSASDLSDAVVPCIIVRTDADGREQWRRELGREGTTALCAGLEIDRNAYVLAGHIIRLPGKAASSGFLVRLDDRGDSSWCREFTAEGSALLVSCLSRARNGGFLVAGSKSSYRPAEQTSAYLVLTDGDGRQICALEFGETGKCSKFNAIEQTQDGGHVLVGVKRLPFERHVGPDDSGNRLRDRRVYVVKIAPVGSFENPPVGSAERVAKG